ncbi:MAG TPA: SDR family oxidoreductase [Geminicoccaceae bacterium]|jgi:3-oxoacyl-[acyl-carrier protein] reductase|nr:SDR family oxidoreductase [Geminicoccaceae bacterium]
MTRWEGFADRTAVVTGAGGGMGLQIARDLLEAGARVTGIDVKDRPGELEGAAYAQGDVSDERFVAGAIGAAFAESGRLDYLVNAAGVLWFGRDRSLLDIDLEIWNRVIAINLTGCMLTARHAIPLMRRAGGGAMVHFSSTQCLRGDDRPQDAYQVAKAGILALSKSIAIQFAPAKIRSNVILPSATESPMQARWEKDPESKRATAAGVPLGRVGTTHDMASACLFLLSDEASFITGTELLVDGGRMAVP